MITADTLLNLLSNSHRRLMLGILTDEGETSVGILCQRVGLTQSMTSQHLARMREAGVVTTRRDGTTVYYSLTDERTRRLLAAIRQDFPDEVAA